MGAEGNKQSGAGGGTGGEATTKSKRRTQGEEREVGEIL